MKTTRLLRITRLSQITMGETGLIEKIIIWGMKAAQKKEWR